MAFWERRDSKAFRKWTPVDAINSYAVLMGYLSMAIKGLGFLVLTWTTVVLLGGFVSTLHKNDFWSLTFITLVQTAGIFDVVLNEKLSYVMTAIIGLLTAVFLGVVGNLDESLMLVLRILLALIVLLVQVLVLAAVLCPLAIIYVFGILLSGGISLWRLIKHDYRGSDGEASNLPSAMDTLYYLAVIQCVLFCYRYVLGRMGKRLASTPSSDLDKQVFSRYLRDTKRGCEKDPLFAEGRDLSTHAIHLIDSKSPIDCISGVEMLYVSIRFFNSEERKQFVRAVTSSGKVLQKLLEMLDPKGLHDRETKNQAADILDWLASDINLEQFPRWIHYISSLIGTFQEYSVAHPVRQRWNSRGELVQDYKELLLRGLCIIGELASSENNCRVIRDTQDLVSKIMAPITSDLLHHTVDDHGEWSGIVEKSVEVMSQLTSAPGESGAKLRHDISRCEEATSTLRRILSCNKCTENLQQRAIQILTRLYMDTTEGSKAADSVPNKESSSREDFVRMLVDIFTSDDKYSSSVRGCAGGALSEICSRSGISNAMPTRGDIVDGLTEVLVHDKSNICREAAAEILSNLYTHCMELSTPSSDVLPSSPTEVPSVFASTTRTPPLISSPPSKDDDPGKLRQAILKVLGEILHCGERTHERKEVDQDTFAKPKDDIESQCDNGHTKGINSSSSSHPRKDEKNKEEKESVMSATLLSSLLTLFGTVYDTTFISDLPPHLDASSFLNMLKEVVVKKRDHPTVENLLLFKAVAKMVILMMKHSGHWSVKKADLESLLEALFGAWREILYFDYSMIFSSFDSNSATTSSKLNRCTLASLLKEAQELHAKVPSTSVSG